MKIYGNVGKRIKRNSTKNAVDRLNCFNSYSPFDPFGSYTGICKYTDKKPIQNADDL